MRSDRTRKDKESKLEIACDVVDALTSIRSLENGGRLQKSTVRLRRRVFETPTC
jgi:hypothetical protein